MAGLFLLLALCLAILYFLTRYLVTQVWKMNERWAYAVCGLLFFPLVTLVLLGVVE